MRYVFYGFIFAGMAVSLLAFQNCATADGLRLEGLRVKEPVAEMPADAVKKRLEAAAKTCADFRGREVRTRLPAGARVGGAVNLVARAERVERIEGSGNLVLLGETPAAKIARLEDFQGNIYLCGVSVEHVGAGFRGNLIAVGGDLARVESPAANFTLLGATHGGLPPAFRGSLVAGESAGEGRGLTYSGQ